MADTKREIERKYEAKAKAKAKAEADADTGTGTDAGSADLPDLTRVPGVAAVVDKGVAELDAVYYDTADQRLAAASLTLRRRTGGDDAGWHLKLPVSDGVRDEIHAPLSDTVPRTLTGLVRSRVRDAELVPVVRLLSARDVRHLVDASGELLAEVSVDRVRAERLSGGDGTARWTEIEVELADGGDPAFLDKVEKKLRKAGISRSRSSSKLARALSETGRTPRKEAVVAAAPVTAGDHVLAYVRAQRDAIVELDPAVRRDVHDAVHSMRVATRRLRSTFRSYDNVLDRAVTDPIRDELKWLAGELGVDRDQEVLTERLTAALGDLPRPLLAGPVRGRLRTWAHVRRSGSRHRLVAVLDGGRYLDLLVSLDSLLATPPLRKAAADTTRRTIEKAVRKDFDKLSGLVREAVELPPGEARDLAIHEARKKTKRTRYAAELAAPVLGRPAKGLVSDMKSLQGLLGEHQDSVMARPALRDLAAQAHAAGENGFTYGVLYGREERTAASVETALPTAWETIRNRGAL